MGACRPVARCKVGSRAEFEERFVRTGTPVILEGAIADWPAHARWTAEHLARFADQPVRIGADARRSTFGEFLGSLDDPKAYLNLDPLAFPQLLEDIAVPTLIDPESVTQSLFWLGSTSRFNLHYDDAENLHCVVRGRKTFHLISPDQYPSLYPVTARRSRLQGINWSEIDFFAPDLERFDRFANVETHRAELGPTDVLYLPIFWWHAVEHFGRPTISINFWWPSPNGCPHVFYEDRILIAELKRRLSSGA